MTKVDILKESTDNGKSTFRAIAGDKQSVGRTAGEALDALTAQLPMDDVGTLVVVQSHGPDEFFPAEQQRRLGELMTQWRNARDRGVALPSDLQAELDRLVETELQASAKRTEAILAKLTS